MKLLRVKQLSNDHCCNSLRLKPNETSISLEASPGQGGLDIYSTMEKRVREWLVSSGSLPTIQARLRADLYAAIQVACLCIVFLESLVLFHLVNDNNMRQMSIQEQASDPALRLKPKERNANVNLPTR